MRLNHTRIYRGGVTASTWRVETTDCRFEIVNGDCRFRFDIGSKGGGRTDLGVVVAPQDLPDILATIAREVPGAARMLSQAAAEAVASLDTTARDAHATLTRCGDAVESWDESASQRYYESDDSDEEQLREQEMELASETWRAMARSTSALGQVVSTSAESHDPVD